MKTVLSLNGCAKRLLSAAKVEGPRFDLFWNPTRPSKCQGRIGHAYFPIGGHCMGQQIPAADWMMIGLFPNTSGGQPAATLFSAS